MTLTIKTDATSIRQAETELRQEHMALRELAVQLGGAQELEELWPGLDQLHENLRKHFAHEEYPGGIYDRVGACSRTYRDRVRALVDDHYRMLTTVLGLSNRAKQADKQATDEILKATRTLLERVRSHERREHEMIEDAFQHQSKGP